MVILQKIITLVVVFLLSTSLSLAQTMSCPITEMPFISAANAELELVVSDSWSGQVVITNPTTYILPDLRIGVGIYLKDGDETPKYWVTLPTRYTVRPSEAQLVNLEIGTTHIPAGEYHLKFFVAQGDDFAPFGNALQKVAAPVVTIKKETLPESPIIATVATKGGEVTESSVSPLTIETTVNNSSPNFLLDNVLLEVRVGKGVSPVGTSVVTREETKQRIFPGNSRTTSVTAEFLEPGTYTSVALLRGGNELLPVAVSTTVIGDSDATYLPVQVSIVGISAYPVGEAVEAVACVAAVPMSEDSMNIYDVINQRLVFAASAGEAEIGSVTNELTLGGDSRTSASTFAITNAETEVMLSAQLFENRFGKDELIETRTVTINCDTFETCDEIKPLPEEPKSIFTPLSPVVFFYLVMFLVAILIGYVALRKQPIIPTDKNS